MVDKDGDSLQDMQMYSPSHWAKESGLHSLGGNVFNEEFRLAIIATSLHL